MGKSGGSSPPPRDLGKEISQILGQEPALLASEGTYSPQRIGLGLSNLDLALNGSSGGTRTVYDDTPVQGFLNTRTGEFSTSMPNPRAGRGGREAWIPYTQRSQTARQVNVPAQRGLLSQYTDAASQLDTANNAANTINRTAAYNDLRNLNPGQAQLYDLLNSTATTGLQAGSRLLPEDAYRISQSVRGDFANRGLAASDPAQLQEALQLYGGGQQLLQQRMGMANDVAQLGSSLYTMPAMTLAQRSDPSALLGFGSGYTNQPNILQQLGGYGSDLFNTNFNSQAASNINRANANNAAVSNGVAAAGTIATIAIAA